MLPPRSRHHARRNVFAFVCLLAFPVIVMAETRVDLDRSKDFRQYKTFSVEVSPPIRTAKWMKPTPSQGTASARR